VFIFYLSSLSNPPRIIPFPEGTPHADKWSHMILFFVLGVLTFRAFRDWFGDFFRRHYIKWALLFGLLYGALDEWHQYFVPKRQTDFWDWAADATGVIIGGYLYVLYRKARERLGV